MRNSNAFLNKALSATNTIVSPGAQLAFPWPDSSHLKKTVSESHVIHHCVETWESTFPCVITALSPSSRQKKGWNRWKGTDVTSGLTQHTALLIFANSACRNSTQDWASG